MDPKTQQPAAAGANRVYEDFDPPFDWAHDERSATLVMYLPGFIREQLKVQITSTRIIRVVGERSMVANKWIRFIKELSVPLDCDTNDIAAKFERGTLYIKFAKLITPSKPKPQPQPQPQQQQQQPPPPQKDAPPMPMEEKAVHEEEPKKMPQVDQKEPSDKAMKEKGISEEAKTPEKTQEKQKVSDQTQSQTQNYKEGIVGLVGELKKQKKLAKLLVAVLLVLLLGLYVKNAIKSSLGRSKIQEL